MTFVEALIALVLATGVVVAALDASRLISARSGSAALEIEALLRAESLLGAAATDPVRSAGVLEGQDSPDVHWMTNVQPRSYGGQGPAQAFEIASQVTITRGGARVRRSLTTLKVLENMRR